MNAVVGSTASTKKEEDGGGAETENRDDLRGQEERSGEATGYALGLTCDQLSVVTRPLLVRDLVIKW
jgi:hypothetical protein